ncbi:hypothetical protein SNE40_001453 [Patella caerulea]|uniref:BCL2-associated athanogene 6 n=1 Tax=Patella caerulea TaxID=87958 RepID=A0AAN8KCJ3_PATCE
MDVTVKTLDGQNKNYNVAEDMTVRQFKEKIADSINIEADTQRLIFHGRVLQDDKPLKEYDVNGKVIHVVQRAPPSSRSESSSNNTTTTTSSSGGTPRSVVVGSFTLPTDILDPNQVQNIVQNAVAGMGDQWRNARVSTRASADGSPIDVRINLGQIPQQAMDQGQIQVNSIRRIIRQVRRLINLLQNPPSETATGGASSSEEASMSSSPDEPSTPTDPNPESTTQNTTDGASNSTQTGRPGINVLADLLEEVQLLNADLQPFLDRYRQVLQDDAPVEETQSTQRMCNMVSEAMHAMSHVYHGISDFMVDISAAPPRHLYSPPSTMMGMFPRVQRTQINVGNGRAGRPSTQNSSSNRTTSSQSSSTTTTAPSSTAMPMSTSTNPTVTSALNGTGSNLPPGVSVAGSSDPYVYVEVGPDSVTLNSISAHVITSTHDPSTPIASAASSTTMDSNQTGPQTTPATPNPGPTPTSTPQASGNMPDINVAGVQLPPGAQLPPGFIQGLVNSVLQSQGGARPRHPVQINFIPLNRAEGQMRVVGMRPPSVDIRMSSATRVPAPSSSTNQTFTTSTTTSTPSAPTSSTTTSTSTNTSTSSSSATTTNSQTRLPRQMDIADDLNAMFGGGMPGRPVDPYLPCSSRHYLTQQARNTAGPRVQPNPEAGLADMVSGLMSGLLGGEGGAQPHIHIHRGPPPTAASTASNTARSNTESTPSGGPRVPGPDPSHPFASLFSPLGTPGGPIPHTDNTQQTNAFRNILTNVFETALHSNTPPSATNSTGTSNTTSSSTPAPPPPAGATNPNAMFLDLFGGIGQQLSAAAGSRESNTTISDFVSNMSATHNLNPEEGFVSDMFQVISRHLTFTDLFGVFSGRSERLGQLQGPLKEFCRERVLKGREYNEDNLRTAIEEVIEEMEPELQSSIDTVEVKQGIDLMATIKNFLRQQLRATIRLILNSEDGDSNFGKNIYERVRRLLGEFITLTPICLVEGNAAFQRMLQHRLHGITSSMNPMIQQWMITMTSQHIQTFRQSYVITEAEVQHYIVKTGATTPAGAAAILRAERTEVPMDVSSPPATTAMPRTSQTKTEQPQKATAVESKPKSSEVQHAATRSNAAMNGTSSSGVTSPIPGATPKSVNIATNGEDWRAVVPEEWVPIISQDIQRQKQNRPQPPLSDAYLQGLPAKRRKVMTSDRPSNSLANMAEYIPESIRHAAATLGVEPISSFENLTQEASTNSDLQNALNGEIDRTIVRRLEKDSDYISERFPNAEQCYRPKKSER